MNPAELIEALSRFWHVYTTVPHATQSARHIAPVEQYFAKEIQAALPEDETRTRFVVRHGCMFPKNCDVVHGVTALPKLVVSCKSINSSYGNNARNRVEEAIADAVNLRIENPALVMGLVFIISDTNEARGVSANVRRSTNYVEFFEQLFEVFGGRSGRDDDLHKYERIAYLPVDFQRKPPQLEARCFDVAWKFNSKSFCENLVAEVRRRR